MQRRDLLKSAAVGAGLVAHRVSKKIACDPATGRVTNAPAANHYLQRTYRSGWTLGG